MSLINDALKRAESEKRATQSSGTPPLQPVESPSSHSTSPLLLGGIFLLGVGAIAIAAALWFGGRKTEVVQTAPAPEPAKVESAASPIPADRRVQAGTQSAPVSQSALTTITSAPVTIASPAQKSVAQSLKPVTTTTTQAGVTTPKSAASVTPPATATPTQPKPIRLQSIFYRHKNPTVIINGKTLRVGETVDGIKVDSIRRTSVEIVQNGKYRTLTLQD
jgi:hypothetical protein